MNFNLILKSGFQQESVHLQERGMCFSRYKSDDALTLPQSLLGPGQLTTSPPCLESGSTQSPFLLEILFPKCFGIALAASREGKPI